MFSIEILKQYDALHSQPEPVIISSDMYQRLRKAGYIGEGGEFTDKAHEAVAEFWDKAIAKHRQELSNG